MFAENSEPRIELAVKNFGPIAEAKVDLRPLTVFVGPSNTGKSYLAILIYSLHNVLQTQPFRLFRRRPGRAIEDDLGFPSAGRADDAASKMSHESALELERWLSEGISSRHRSRSHDTEYASLPLDLGHAIQNVLTGNQPQYADKANRVVTRSFGLGTDLTPLVRHSSKGPAQVDLRTEFDSQDNAYASFVQELRLGQRRPRYETRLSEDSAIPLAPGGLRYLRSFILESLPMRDLGDRERTIWLGDAIQTLSEHVLGELSGPFSRSAYYLPADRTGVMHAHNVVVGALLDSAPYAGIRERRSNAVMTGVLADFLREMMEIGEIDVRARKGGSEAVASKIEQDVLQGAVKSNRTEAGHPTFSYQPQGWSTQVPLSRTSSMVSELAPVVMYLRHLVEAGDTIIIEEPESHLHPAAQAEFAISLGRLVKHGVRVIVTTHSNWIVDQFANLIKLGELDSEDRKDFIGGDAALSPDDVSAWAFIDRGTARGSVVEEIQYESDGIGFDAGYLRIADSQYDIWAEATNRRANKMIP